MSTESNERLEFQRASGVGSAMQGEMQQEGVVEKATDKAQEIARDVKDKAGERLSSSLAKGKSRTAETLSGVAQSLKQSSQQLRDRNETSVSQYIEQAADRMERISSYLQDTDVAAIVDRVEDFARRQPALFLGGTFALGLLGARFIKSSRRQEAQSPQTRQSRATYSAGITKGEFDVTGFRATAVEMPRRESAAPRRGDEETRWPNTPTS